MVPISEGHKRRYPSRVRNKPDLLGFSSSNCVHYPVSNYVSYHRLSKSHLVFTFQLSSASLPKSFQEAIEDPKWKSAMVEEMKAIQKNATWDMVNRPRKKRTV